MSETALPDNVISLEERRRARSPEFSWYSGYETIELEPVDWASPALLVPAAQLDELERRIKAAEDRMWADLVRRSYEPETDLVASGNELLRLVSSTEAPKP